MTVREQGWALFDGIVASAPAKDLNPWRIEKAGDEPRFHPDHDTLARLLAVPVHLHATSQSGVPALALDVWAAYEFRRAGFDPDAVWPRAHAPRVMPAEVATLLAAVPRDLRADLTRRMQTSGGLKGLPGSNATVLGKNYVKQVDVGMSSWRTGPELLISTKRMDSSFAKNAANRVEESYGDAKNLRLRHPRAALGFLYGLRSTALTEEPDKAEWLKDLLAKLGREEDAYDAVALVVPEWTIEAAAVVETGEPPGENAFVAAGLADDDYDDSAGDAQLSLDRLDLEEMLAALPSVLIRTDAVPSELGTGRFFDVLVRRVLDNCPINFHQRARESLASPRT